MGFEDDDFGGFNTSDGFGGDTDSFGDDFSDGFGAGDMNDNFGGDSFNTSFDDGFSNNNTNNFSGNETSNGEFDNMFDNAGGVPADDTSSANLKKTAIVAIIAGIAIIVVVLCFVSLMKKRNTTQPNDKGVTIVEQPVNQEQYVPQNKPIDTDANNIMQSGNEPAGNTYIGNTSGNEKWTVIDDNQKIEFLTDYKELTFFITNIEHRAKMSDSNLIVKTILTGSLSGMSGSYELEIPYFKGTQLHTGQEFTVKVLLGSFNGKTVVGDIKY